MKKFLLYALMLPFIIGYIVIFFPFLIFLDFQYRLYILKCKSYASKYVSKYRDYILNISFIVGTLSFIWFSICETISYFYKEFRGNVVFLLLEFVAITAILLPAKMVSEYFYYKINYKQLKIKNIATLLGCISYCMCWMFYSFVNNDELTSKLAYLIIPFMATIIIISIDVIGYINNSDFFKDIHFFKLGSIVSSAIILISSQAFASELIDKNLGLPVSDFEITYAFMTLLCILIITSLICCFFFMLIAIPPCCIHIFNCISKKKINLKDFDTILAAVVLIYSLLCFTILKFLLKTNVMNYMVNSVAYHSDYQTISSYWKNKPSNSAIKFKLHENGVVSLMCFNEKQNTWKLDTLAYDDIKEKNDNYKSVTEKICQ